MPNPVIGINQLMAIKKAAAWGTEVVCGAGDGILFLSGQAKREATVQIEQSRGKAWSKNGTAGPITSPSTYIFNLSYAGFELLAAAQFGTAGVPAQQGGTTAYLHTLKWTGDIYGTIITLARNLVAYIESIPTAKVNGITISGEIGADPLQVSLEVIGINREIASAVNTLATFASVTIPTDHDTMPVMFSHLQFRINAQGGAALGNGDKIYPTKFTLTMKRNQKGEPTGQYRTTGSNPQDCSDEPTMEDFPELKLSLEFPTHSATTYLAALNADTRYKGDIIATGPLISGAYNYGHTWQMPHMQLLTVNPTDGKGRIKEPLEFLLHGASAAPTGMVGCTEPIWWLQTTKDATNPLA